MLQRALQSCLEHESHTGDVVQHYSNFTFHNAPKHPPTTWGTTMHSLMNLFQSLKSQKLRTVNRTSGSGFQNATGWANVCPSLLTQMDGEVRVHPGEDKQEQRSCNPRTHPRIYRQSQGRSASSLDAERGTRQGAERWPEGAGGPATPPPDPTVHPGAPTAADTATSESSLRPKKHSPKDTPGRRRVRSIAGLGLRPKPPL